MNPTQCIAALIYPRMPKTVYDREGTFDPWAVFGLYGTYSSDFDEMALEVLGEVYAGEVRRTDLAARMFRELLCRAGLCDYGSNPRTCFSTTEFDTVLPVLINRWQAWHDPHWSETETQNGPEHVGNARSGIFRRTPN